MKFARPLAPRAGLEAEARAGDRVFAGVQPRALAPEFVVVIVWALGEGSCRTV